MGEREPLRVAVVGAGIVGVCVAEWLRRDGHEVLLIDRVEPGSREQTSFGNAGMLARCAVVPVPVPGLWAKVPGMLFSKDSPLSLRWSQLPRMAPWLLRYLSKGREAEVRRIAEGLSHLLLDSPDQHRRIAEGTPAQRFIKDCEYLYLYKDRAAYEADAFGWGLRAEFGLRTRPVERAELESIAPGIAPGQDFAMALLDHGTITNPSGYLTALARHFTDQGGRFLKAEVEAIEPEAEAIAIKAGGELLRVDRVVLAAGIWSKRLAERLGHKTAMESERGYHVMLEGPSMTPRSPLMVASGKFAMTPMEEGLRLAGLVEYGGFGAAPAEAPVEFLKGRARKLFPDLTWKAEKVWEGHRPTTVDSLPLLGPSPREGRVLFAFGAQHIGLTSGPKTGRIVADMIAGRRVNFDLAPYRVGRFD